MARQSTHQTKANPEKSPRRDPTASGERDAAVNRIASHNYFLLEKFEAGVVLTGTEVKSIRGGLANFKDSYGLVKDDAVWLLNAHIGPYEHGNIFNHAPLRTRKLLMHREEIRKLIGKTQQKGLTLIPTRLYFKNGRVKVELALAKGKQLWDKRETERRRTADKEAREAVSRSRKAQPNEAFAMFAEFGDSCALARFKCLRLRTRNGRRSRLSWTTMTTSPWTSPTPHSYISPPGSASAGSWLLTTTILKPTISSGGRSSPFSVVGREANLRISYMVSDQPEGLAHQDRKSQVRYAVGPGGAAAAGPRARPGSPAETFSPESDPRLRIDGRGRRHPHRGAKAFARTGRGRSDSRLYFRGELVEER